jgi:OFA family oxalate/formate antiporter-like MFS transporter
LTPPTVPGSVTKAKEPPASNDRPNESNATLGRAIAMSAISNDSAGTGRAPANRWVQLIAGIVCMVAAANIQYAWTLFVPEIQETYGWSRASIQTAFTIFVIVQTWLTPIEGYFIDKYGPRALVLVGGVMTGLSWVVNSYATSLPGFYVGAAIGGIGVGCVYATCINAALKWFPDRRGLAVGLTAGGYGAGSALTIIPIANVIAGSGYQTAFFWFGLIQGSIVFAAAWFLRAPGKQEVKHSTKVTQTRRDYTLGEALQSRVFYVMLFMFICTVTGGLMAVAQLGISRPFFGWVSDHIGREKTMCIAFTMEGIGIVALGTFGHNPWAFLILSGVVFLAWGEVYSLFSATAGDTFGTKHLGKIYGVLYCAKGVAALLVPFGNLLMEATGTWSTVLYTVAAMDLIAAFTAIVVLRPMLIRHHARNAAAATVEAQRPASHSGRLASAG